MDHAVKELPTNHREMRKYNITRNSSIQSGNFSPIYERFGISHQVSGNTLEKPTLKLFHYHQTFYPS